MFLLPLILPGRRILLVSTLVPSDTGGMSRSMTVTFVLGYRRAMTNAEERPKTPAPTMITEVGKEVDMAIRQSAEGESTELKLRLRTPQPIYRNTSTKYLATLPISMGRKLRPRMTTIWEMVKIRLSFRMLTAKALTWRCTTYVCLSSACLV
jgi:hypothetical protein